MRSEGFEEWVPVARPWGPMEPCSGQSAGDCHGAIGDTDGPCKNPVKWSQTATFGGSVVYYCDEHKKLQEEWDKILYDSPPKPLRKIPNGYFDEVQKLFERMNRKKRKKEEQNTEIDPS